jgi:hypothetical protein
VSFQSVHPGGCWVVAAKHESHNHKQAVEPFLAVSIVYNVGKRAILVGAPESGFDIDATIP